jgi:hypothetical protein
MTHYGIAQWVDFSRDLIPPGRRDEMQGHLSACTDCQAAFDFYAKLTRVFRRVVESVVPEDAVRKARSVFPAQPATRSKRPFRISAALVYDSFLVPAPAGLRSSWQAGWQALFRAGDCSVDLRVEPELRSAKTFVVGQISNHLTPAMPMSDLPVYLKAGKQVVAETRSNRFGEFQMEYRQQTRLQLCIDLNGGAQCIQLPLKKLADKRSIAARSKPAANPKPGGEKPV